MECYFGMMYVEWYSVYNFIVFSVLRYLLIMVLCMCFMFVLIGVLFKCWDLC